MRLLIHSSTERKHLLRFYLASFSAEATHMAMPFKVLLVARYLGAGRLVVVLAIEQAVALLMEVPTGAWADRFGRKRCVLAGHLIVVLGWLLVPAATLLDRTWRWPAMAAAFALQGAGAALISGNQEAWVVDNLQASEQPDLIGCYFGRDRFWASAGGILANLLALALVAKVDLRLFWVITAIGELVATLVLAFAPEELPVERQPAAAPPSTEPAASGSLLQRRDLISLALVLTWFSATFGMSTETFQLALAGARMSEHGFAVLELMVSGLGALALLLAIGLLERFEAKNLLTIAIVISALLSLSLCAGARMGQLAATYLLVRTAIRMLYTVADDFQHRLLTSSHRATASSTINFMAGLAQLGSAVAIAYLLPMCSARTVLAGMGVLALPAVLLLIPRGASATVGIEPIEVTV